MARLKHIGALFLAKLLATVMAGFGLIAGVLYSVGGAVYDLATTHGMNAGTALAFLALLGMPLLFSAVGFVAGIVGAPLYNLAAKRFGGITLDIGQ